LVVHTDHASKEVQEMGEDEAYTLEVTSAGAKLNAANPLGVLRGLQTFLQLIETGDVLIEIFGTLCQLSRRGR